MTVFLLLALAIFVGSVVAHEAGHVCTARALGGRSRGLVWRWYGVGYAVEVERTDTWKVALGGLVATAWLALSFLILGPLLGPLAELGFNFNAALLLTNMVPHPALDGGHVLRGFRR